MITNTEKIESRGSDNTHYHNQLVPLRAEKELFPYEKHDDFGYDKVSAEILEKYFSTEVMGLSRLTIKSKREDLIKFVIYFKSLTGALDFKTWMPSDTKAFLDELQKQDYAPATINRILASLRSFGKWLRDEGVIALDPCRKVKQLQLSPFTPKRISDIDYRRLVRTTEVLQSARRTKISQHFRNKAIMALLNNSGLRIWEVLNLKLSQLNGKILKQILCKGGKVRDVRISKDCAEVLEEYVTSHRKAGSNYVFTNRYGKRLSRNGIAKAFHKVESITNVTLKDDDQIHVTPHKFRHSVGFRARELKGDVWAASRLGHSTLNYIGRYATFDEKQESDLVEKL